MVTLEWGALTEADLPALTQLATECLAADGGLPTLSQPDFLRSLFLSGGPAIGGRDDTGDLVAAASLFEEEGQQVATGLVLPSMRDQGAGDELVRWCREQRGPEPLRVRVENCSVASESMLARAGLRRIFAETVMRHRLRDIPIIARPPGVRLLPFTEQIAPAFHRAWAASFADRPGFVPSAEEEWLRWLAEDADFRAADSRVALADDDTPVGMVTLSTDWIDQVGVVPQWRGRSLGAHLVVRSLTALKRAGSRRVWLCVNVDNPARDLYERLGFRARGTRARYTVR